MSDLTQKIKQIMLDNPNLLPSDIANQLAISELDVISTFPQKIALIISGKKAKNILEELSTWGDVTVIVHAHGSIFEVKAPLPFGRTSHGYYNLDAKKGQLHGHLKLERITNIALISRNFMGRESHCFCFFSKSGESIFKIYLGRDSQHQLISSQLTKFDFIKQTFQSSEDN